MSARKMSARRMRTFMLLWLCLLLLDAVRWWTEFHDAAGSAATAGARARVGAYTMTGVSLLGLFLLLRVYRRPGARAWVRLRRFFGNSGLGLVVVSVAFTVFPTGGGTEALSGMLFLGVINLMFWDRLRDSNAQGIWEQDQEDVAPVRDNGNAGELRLQIWIVLAIAIGIHLTSLLSNLLGSGSHALAWISGIALVLSGCALVLGLRTTRSHGPGPWRLLTILMYCWGTLGCLGYASAVYFGGSDMAPSSRLLLVGGLPSPLQLFLARNIQLWRRRGGVEREALPEAFD